MDDKISLQPNIEVARHKPFRSINIRPMIAEDIERVHLIDKLSFTLPWPINSYRYELFENPASILHVAEVTLEDGLKVIAGMIVTWLIIDEAHVATIAVHPNFRRRGIGHSLLLTSLREAIHQGAKVATLEVRQGNASATNLYSQFGFKEEGRRPRYYHDNQEDAIIMTVTEIDENYLNRLSEHKQVFQDMNGEIE